MRWKLASPAIGSLCLIALVLVNSGSADDAPARTKSRKKPSVSRAEEVPQRIQRLESALEAAQAELKAHQTEKTAVRYQMLSAGKRVVILDTHTGETRIIEPETGRAYQSIDVGKAWVVVTVLGNASETTNSDTQQKPKP